MKRNYRYQVAYTDSESGGEQHKTEIYSSQPLKKHQMEALLVEQLCENHILVEWLTIVEFQER